MARLVCVFGVNERHRILGQMRCVTASHLGYHMHCISIGFDEMTKYTPNPMRHPEDSRTVTQRWLH